MGIAACGCKGQPNVVKMDEQAQACIDALSKKPELKHYKEDPQAVKNAEALYASNVYGGSVFSPIGRMVKGTVGKRDIKNPLEEEISKAPVSILYGGGFYVLKNVKYAANVYADIWIMVEALDDPEIIKKFHIYNNIPREERKGKEGLKFDNIKKHLNGYGRIIYFTTNDANFKAEKCKLIKVHEGKFKQSEPDGYCRVFNAPEDGSCEVGYWKEKEPMGKYQKFDIKGEILEQGIKEGDTLTKSCEINSYQTRLIKTAKDDIGKSAMSGLKSKLPNAPDADGAIKAAKALVK